MLLSLLLCQSIVYMELSHFEESLKCCNEALGISKEAPEVYYRKSQAAVYNLSSTLKDLENALSDIEAAIKMSPNKKLYHEHAKLVRQRISEMIELNKRIANSIIEAKPPKSEEAISKPILDK
eukprot:TRINITY_DN14905_c0_g1_i1.p2 TRINITY_DN14905_c0_g1~~TRINITY_DN14905_c0_g1_i1.p2  ORF type:complete len:123 (+),score=28.20 TRINITY_DN14905_c0_g1_i1:723-1091(+)